MVNLRLLKTYFSVKLIGFRANHRCPSAEGTLPLLGATVRWSVAPVATWDKGFVPGRMGRGDTESTDMGELLIWGGGARTGLNAGD